MNFFPVIKFSTSKISNRRFDKKMSRRTVGRSTLIDINKKLAFTCPLATLGMPRRIVFDKFISTLRKYPRFADHRKIKYDRIQFIHKMQGYRSLRLRGNLPARGQRTHTNAKTRKKRRVI